MMQKPGIKQKLTFQMHCQEWVRARIYQQSSTCGDLQPLLHMLDLLWGKQSGVESGMFYSGSFN